MKIKEYRSQDKDNAYNNGVAREGPGGERLSDGSLAGRWAWAHHLILFFYI